MEVISLLVDWMLHLDEHLAELVTTVGPTATVLILCGIVFAETGLVITPFLPGDSLLFATGAIAAATGTLDFMTLFVGLSAAAILGDAVNFKLGQLFGARAAAGGLPLVQRRHIERTEAFFARHGGKTIVLARFVPIVRTYAPFVAGAGSMSYARFATFNVLGGVGWVGSMLGAGYLFGGIPVVRDNFGVVVIGIIVASLLPVLYAAWRDRAARAAT